MSPASLKILVVSAEAAPFAKTGGLADVAASLPRALAAAGHDVRIVLPFYRKVAAGAGMAALPSVSLELDPPAPPEGMPSGFGLRESRLPGSKIPVYFIDQPRYFDRDGFYGDSDGDYPDNGDRFSFYARAVLAAAKAAGFKPDVIHCNDWHTALIPAYLKTFYRDSAFFAACGSLFTIHNLAYQGLFPDWQFGRTGLPWELYQAESMEFYGQLNFMKGALYYADKLNTVSPRYAEEIKTPEFGCGLEGVLKGRAADLSGIINGLDYDEWSPGADKHLPLAYDASTLGKKAELKKLFLKEVGLPADEDVALLGMVTRLDNMKGLSLVEEILDYLMHMDLQFVLLGTGEQRFHESFRRLAETFPEKASVHLSYNNDLAHRIEAASDIFLMPSRFEPCGLNQLISLRYGTVPVVRAVGGLADTVKEFDPKSGSGNGFVFSEYSSMGLFNAIKRALELYPKKDAWQKLQKNGMAEDHSWAASARKYEALYREIKAAKQA